MIKSLEKEALTLFAERVNELKEFARKPSFQNFSLNISGEKGRPIRITAKLPTEDEIKSFLMTFRFFYLKNEVTLFNKICNALIANIHSTDIKNRAIDYRKAFNKILNGHSRIKFDFLGEELTTNKTIDLWFNAFYFHADNNKRPKLIKIRQLLSDDFAKYLLLSCVTDLSNIIIAFQKEMEGQLNDHISY